jgi:ABC-2 type transport system permease protein/lipopolysaccharide transport system permease protein
MDTRTSVTPPHAEFFPPPAAPDAQPWWSGLRDDYLALQRFAPVVQNMVVQELRVRYHRSVLGFFWSLLNPILMMATLTVVFSQLMQKDARHYAVYLFAGMVPWTLLQTTITDCAFCIITNENLIRKIYLPKLVFPLARLLINLTTFALSLGAMFVMLLPLGARFSWAMLALPVVTLLFAMFALGLGLVMATANTFFRDCSHLVTVFLQAWYFMTPILYEIRQLRPEAQWRFWLNPAYPFIRMFQAIIHDGQWPDPATALLGLGIAVAVLGAGYAVFKSHEDKLIFRL